MSHIQIPLDLQHVRVLKVEARKGGGKTMDIRDLVEPTGSPTILAVNAP